MRWPGNGGWSCKYQKSGHRPPHEQSKQDREVTTSWSGASDSSRRVAGGRSSCTAGAYANAECAGPDHSGGAAGALFLVCCWGRGFGFPVTRVGVGWGVGAPARGTLCVVVGPCVCGCVCAGPLPNAMCRQHPWGRALVPGSAAAQTIITARPFVRLRRPASPVGLRIPLTPLHCLTCLSGPFRLRFRFRCVRKCCVACGVRCVDDVAAKQPQPVGSSGAAFLAPSAEQGVPPGLRCSGRIVTMSAASPPLDPFFWSTDGGQERWKRN